MDAVVGGVVARRDGGSVGGPHRGGRACLGEQDGIVVGGTGEDGSVVAIITESAERGKMRAFVRREDA
jgi:hypothetical protein